MKKKLVLAVKYLVFPCIGIFLLWIVFRNQNLAAVWKEILKADFSWVFLSVAITFVAHYIRAVRWKMLISPLGYESRLSSSLYAVMGGYIANLALPRLGEVTRCGALSRTEKIPFDKLLGTVIVERIVDVISLLATLVLATFLEYSLVEKFLFVPVGDKLKGVFHSGPLMLLLIAAFVLVIALVFSYRKKILSSSLFTKIKSLTSGIVDGLKSIGKMKNTFLYIILTAVMWTLYMLSSYVCFFSLPATSSLDLKAGVFILVAGSLGISAPVQGGIGTFEAIVIAALVLIGISQSDATAYAAVVHGSQILFTIVAGFASIILLNFQERTLHERNA